MASRASHGGRPRFVTITRLYCSRPSNAAASSAVVASVTRCRSRMLDRYTRPCGSATSTRTDLRDLLTRLKPSGHHAAESLRGIVNLPAWCDDGGHTKFYGMRYLTQHTVTTAVTPPCDGSPQL